MKYLLIFAFVSVGHFASSQIEPINNTFWNSYSYYNPAMSAVHFKHEGNLIYRTDFQNTTCAPSSFVMNYGANLKEKHALGFNLIRLINDGSLHRNLKLNYNYQINLNEDENKQLVIGSALNYGRITPLSCGYLDSTLRSENAFFLDAGIAYYTEKFVAGIGITQIPIFSESNRAWEPQLNGNVRYQLSLSPEPNFLVFESSFRTNFEAYSQDFNVRYNFKNILEGGVGYRTSEMLLFSLMGTVRDRYQLGYSIGYSLNATNSPKKSVHEFTLGLRLAN